MLKLQISDGCVALKNGKLTSILCRCRQIFCSVDCLMDGSWPQLVDNTLPILFPFESLLSNERKSFPKASATWKILHTTNPCASLAQIMMLQQVPDLRVQNFFSTFSSLSCWLRVSNWVYLGNLKGRYNQVCWHCRAHLCTNSPSKLLSPLTTVVCICVFC